MSADEHIRGEWLQIPHEDIEATLCIGGMSEVFSTANSACWLYTDRYKAFNNVVREEDDESYSRWFNLPQIDIDTLFEAGITTICPPYPNRDVILGFWAVEMAHYDQELAAGIDLSQHQGYHKRIKRKES